MKHIIMESEVDLYCGSCGSEWDSRRDVNPYETCSEDIYTHSSTCVCESCLQGL